MGLTMFSAQSSPIAIDFGSSSVKLLQISPGNSPALLAAAELPIPDDLRSSIDRRFEFYGNELPGLIRQSRFRGRRASFAISSCQSHIQHVQIAAADGADRDQLVRSQLQMQAGVPAAGMVIRSVPVTEIHRDGQTLTETVCVAIPRETVMRHVQLLKKCRLETVGAHSDLMTLSRAFDRIHRRKDDVNLTTMYVDLGWGGTKVAICHGAQLVFGRSIQVGGRQFDERLACRLKCDLAEARRRRLAEDCIWSSVPTSGDAGSRVGAAEQDMGSPHQDAATAMDVSAEMDPAATGTMDSRRTGARPPELHCDVAPADGPDAAPTDLHELIEALTDDLSMCLRYHESLFRGRPVDRMIFLGGESRQIGLCKQVARSLRMPAHLGDPLARLIPENCPATPGLTPGEPQPGWATACGLCAMPADL